MNTRVELNPNEVRHWAEWYKDLTVNIDHAPLIEGYLERIFETIECALSDSRDIVCVRFDLDLPKNTNLYESILMTQLWASVKAQLLARAIRVGRPIMNPVARYIWVKEETGPLPHFHLAILISARLFDEVGGLASVKKVVKEAWERQVDNLYKEKLCRLSDNPVYLVSLDRDDFLDRVGELFYRLSYFAKEETKLYQDQSRYFSASHKRTLAPDFSLEEIVRYRRYVLKEPSLI